MFELFVAQSEFFLPKVSLTRRPVLRNRLCRGEKGELRKGHVSNRRATEQAGSVHEVAQGARGPWLLERTEFTTLPAVLRPKATSWTLKFSVLANYKFLFSGTAYINQNETVSL